MLCQIHRCKVDAAIHSNVSLLILHCYICGMASINTMEALQYFRSKVLINHWGAYPISDPLRILKVFSAEQFQSLWQRKGFGMLNSTAIFIECRQGVLECLMFQHVTAKKVWILWFILTFILPDRILLMSQGFKVMKCKECLLFGSQVECIFTNRTENKGQPKYVTSSQILSQ